eukprot:10463164-Lingulodinium_polyedra.AAC.1
MPRPREGGARRRSPRRRAPPSRGRGIPQWRAAGPGRCAPAAPLSSAPPGAPRGSRGRWS